MNVTTSSAPPLAPIRVAPGGRYFETFDEQPFLFVGFNDGVSWVRLRGLLGRSDLDSAARYLQTLAERGVTILRLMLECAYEADWYLENPVGHFAPRMVHLWDDLFALCRQAGLRVLLTPLDTFWTSRRWPKHPYSTKSGGPAQTPGDFLTSDAVFAALRRRLEFVIDRWGEDGTIAAWDLFNEIHRHWGDSPEQQSAMIARLSDVVRTAETKRAGWTRPQTVSIFGPQPGEYDDLIYRHPALDFATTHIYEGALDNPRDTLAPTRVMRDGIRHALARVAPGRPFTDSEHGPIHRFNDHKKTLPEVFDDEYERHLMWAHLASGGAGSGMRWPARHPHMITEGTQHHLAHLSAFSRYIAWRYFAPRDIGDEITARLETEKMGTGETRTGKKATKRTSSALVETFGCSDGQQAVVWLLRRKTVGRLRGVTPEAEPLTNIAITLPAMNPGVYAIRQWDTQCGQTVGCLRAQTDEAGRLPFVLPHLLRDLALAITPASGQ